MSYTQTDAAVDLAHILKDEIGKASLEDMSVPDLIELIESIYEQAASVIDGYDEDGYPNECKEGM